MILMQFYVVNKISQNKKNPRVINFFCTFQLNDSYRTDQFCEIFFLLNENRKGAHEREWEASERYRTIVAAAQTYYHTNGNQIFKLCAARKT
jgi:hypothetical protein